MSFVSSFPYQMNFLATSKSGDSRDVTSDNTHFNLWTRSNPILLQEVINGNALSLTSSNFDATKPTKIFAHGWLMNGYNDATVLNMRDGNSLIPPNSFFFHSLLLSIKFGLQLCCIM